MLRELIVKQIIQILHEHPPIADRLFNDGSTCYPPTIGEWMCRPHDLDDLSLLKLYRLVVELAVKAKTEEREYKRT